MHAQAMNLRQINPVTRSITMPNFRPINRMHAKLQTLHRHVLIACSLVFCLLPGALWAQGRGPGIDELLRQQRYTEAVPLLTARADKGDSEAQLMMGLLYFQGAPG
jgi:hypothetical protein